MERKGERAGEIDGGRGRERERGEEEKERDDLMHIIDSLCPNTAHTMNDSNYNHQNTRKSNRLDRRGWFLIAVMFPNILSEISDTSS